MEFMIKNWVLLIERGTEVFGTYQMFIIWLAAERPFFGKQRPIEMSEEDILDELGRIEHGVYS